MRSITVHLLALAVFASTLGIATVGKAANVVGRVTYIGTLSEVAIAGGFSPQFRVRVSDSSCDGGAPGERWIHVVGGRADGVLAHNAVNIRNAYSTIMTAMLAGRQIEIQGIPNCSTSTVQAVNLWLTAVGML
jgi:hypothetical protein